MFSPIVRRSTAVLTLAAALWLAAPPAADAANRRPASKAPANLGSIFLDQVAAWILEFWPTPTPADRSRQQKAGTVMTGGSTEPASAANTENPLGGERGGMIDPNGGW